MVARMLIAVVLAAAQQPSVQRQPIELRCTGVGMDDAASPYAYTLKMTPVDGERYEMAWYADGHDRPVYFGVGIRTGFALAAAFTSGRTLGMAIYVMRPDGSLSGRYTNAGQDRAADEKCVRAGARGA